MRAGQVLQVPVAGIYGIPADASAVSMNVTVTQAASSGYVTVFPCGQAAPLASNLNFVAGQTVPNAVISRVGSNRAICAYSSATTHLVVDLNGYHPAATEYVSVTPVRAADTRSGTGVRGGVLPAGQVLKVPVASTFGVPATASAAVLNVTVTQPATHGYVTVYPCTAPRPTASNLNFVAGQTVPNMVVAKLGQTAGDVCLYTSATTHLVVDINGYFSQATAFRSFNPKREVDTRLDAKGPITVTQINRKQFGKPGELSAVSLNVTVTQPEAAGYLTVYPCAQGRPLASNLNYTKGQTVPNAVISQVDANGYVCFYTMAKTHLVVDWNGSFERFVPDTTPPGPVTSLRAQATTASSVSLAWSNPPDADLAEVIVRRATGSTPPASATSGAGVPLSSPKATAVTDASLASGTTYSYAVFTRDASGNTSNQGVTITVGTVEAAGPSPVTDLRVTAATTSSISLAWLNPLDADLAQVIVRRAAGTTPPAGATSGIDVPLGAPTAQTVDDQGLAPGTQHSYAVFTRDTAGHISKVGATVTGATAAVHGGFTSVSAGGLAGNSAEQSTCALDTENLAWCWGHNSFGQLGDGSTTGSTVPVAVAGGRAYAQISVGANHTCALDRAGKAWCWGSNQRGSLGDGTTAGKSVPVAVAGNGTYQQIVAGNSQTCALDTAGKAWCWGNNDVGQIGDGTTVTRSAPTAVAGNQTFRQITLGTANPCALDTAGRAWCWGFNAHGQIGDGSTTNRSEPVPVAGDRAYAQISSDHTHTCALDTEGRAWCWGSNDFGQVGDGTSFSTTVPVPVAGDRSYSQITVGSHHSCAVDSSGGLWCWGYNGEGQFGDGSTTDQSSPVPSAGGRMLDRLSAGAYDTCGLDDAGTAWCWGSNSSGQLGDGTTTSRTSPVPVV